VLRSGALEVRARVDDQGRLCEVTLPKAVPEGITAEDLAAILEQLEGYALAPAGTDFHRQVWTRMCKIPWGHALTYGELAKEIGNPGAVRAIGQACGRNPLPLIVPCHRILAESGLGGFAYGDAWKQALLALETEPRPKK
jgi:O-6-methylguanine DNA methyltransferase